MKKIEFHLATETRAVKLVNEIRSSQLSLEELKLSSENLSTQELLRKQQELLENLRHVVSSRTKLIIANHNRFNGKEFDKTISQLKTRSELIIKYINNHSHEEFELNVLYSKISFLVIAINQIEGLHESAFHIMQNKSEKLDKDNTLTIFTLIIIATLITLITTRVGISYIRNSLIKQEKIKEEIEKVNNELEQRVQLRTQDLENSNGRLKSSLSQLKLAQNQLVQSEKMASLGGLVAGVAHEINTPIGVGLSAITYLSAKVKQYTEIYSNNNLTKKDFETLLKTSNESCSMVQLNLERAAELIKSFKQVSVDQSQEQKRRINLKSYLDNIYTSLLPKIKPTKHCVKIHCPADIELVSNPGSLSQVFSNLIMNSLFHGFENIEYGEINIDVSKRGNNEIEFLYRDNGVGVPSDIADKIFDPFFTTKREAGGSGLGLHIVYNLITQSMDGSIKLLRNDQEKGVCFIIQLPTGSDEQMSVA